MEASGRSAQAAAIVDSGSPGPGCDGRSTLASRIAVIFKELSANAPPDSAQDPCSAPLSPVPMARPFGVNQNITKLIRFTPKLSAHNDCEPNHLQPTELRGLQTANTT